MKAIILAGGEGTRLRPLTNTLPKALVDINGRTLTDHAIILLKKFGATEFILSLGYMADKVKQHFGDGKRLGAKIDYVVEKTLLGTAGPLILLKKEGKQIRETFIMINGDNLFSLNFKKMLEVHKKNKAIATIALTKTKDVTTSGVVKLEGSKIVEFVEKPKKEDAPSDLISSGYYILEPEVFNYLPDKEKVMMEHDIWPALAKAGKLYGYYDPGLWFDTGTLERLEEVRKKWKV